MFVDRVYSSLRYMEVSIWTFNGCDINWVPVYWHLQKNHNKLGCFIWIQSIQNGHLLSLKRTPAAAKIFCTDADISGPIPSPGISVTVFLCGNKLTINATNKSHLEKPHFFISYFTHIYSESSYLAWEFPTVYPNSRCCLQHRKEIKEYCDGKERCRLPNRDIKAPKHVKSESLPICVIGIWQ